MDTVEQLRQVTWPKQDESTRLTAGRDHAVVRKHRLRRSLVDAAASHQNPSGPRQFIRQGNWNKLRGFFESILANQEPAGAPYRLSAAETMLMAHRSR